MTRQIAVLEEQKNEELEDDNNDDEEAKPSDTSPDGAELNSQSNGLNDKPDINDVPMEETQVKIMTKPFVASIFLCLLEVNYKKRYCYLF